MSEKKNPTLRVERAADRGRRALSLAQVLYGGPEIDQLMYVYRGRA